MIHFDANPEVALHKERFMNVLELVINDYEKDASIGSINITLPEENQKFYSNGMKLKKLKS